MCLPLEFGCFGTPGAATAFGDAAGILTAEDTRGFDFDDTAVDAGDGPDMGPITGPAVRRLAAEAAGAPAVLVAAAIDVRTSIAAASRTASE